MTTSHKIAIVSPYRHRNGQAGARVRAEQLCLALAKDSTVEVVLIAPFSITGVHHVDFDMEGSLFTRLKKLLVLDRILNAIAPTIVISESPLAPLARNRFKIFHVIHDTKFLTGFGRRGSVLAKLLHSISVRTADGVITVSKTEAATIRAAFSVNANVITSYNGIAEHWMTSPAPPAQYEFDIIYVSNFAKHKGHADLVAATRDKPLKVALVGTDHGSEQIVRQAVKNAQCNYTFFSSLSEPELIALYDQSRIMVFPSHLEGFGIPFVEARSRGLPVIANALPVFRELADQLGGKIVDCSNPALLGEAIDEALSACDRERPSTEAINRFRWSEIAAKLMDDIYPASNG